jgi:hypothetical protein
MMSGVVNGLHLLMVNQERVRNISIFLTFSSSNFTHFQFRLQPVYKLADLAPPVNGLGNSCRTLIGNLLELAIAFGLNSIKRKNQRAVANINDKLIRK